MPKAVLIHGWDGRPEEGWFPWLKEELEKLNFEVIVPFMPNPAIPRVEEWVDKVREAAGKIDKDTYFIGHSIGCQAILRYLETVEKKIGGAVFVAGWFELSNLKTKEEKEIAQQWIEEPIDFKGIRNRTKNFSAIFSDDDLFVPLEKNKKIFKKELNANIIIEHNQGHFSGSEGITEVPSVIWEIKKFTEN